MYSSLYCIECEELVKHGPSKEVPGLSDEELGLASEQGKASSTTSEPIYDASGHNVIGLKSLDPTGRRVGIAPTQEKAQILVECLEKAKSFLASSQYVGTVQF